MRKAKFGKQLYSLLTFILQRSVLHVLWNSEMFAQSATQNALDAGVPRFRLTEAHKSEECLGPAIAAGKSRGNAPAQNHHSVIMGNRYFGVYRTNIRFLSKSNSQHLLYSSVITTVFSLYSLSGSSDFSKLNISSLHSSKSDSRLYEKSSGESDGVFLCNSCKISTLNPLHLFLSQTCVYGSREPPEMLIRLAPL